MAVTSFVATVVSLDAPAAASGACRGQRIHAAVMTHPFVSFSFVAFFLLCFYSFWIY
jgi:hypothetical protein